MPIQITESDWKLFRGLHAIAMDRFFKQATAAIKYWVTDETLNPRDRFWKIAKETNNLEQQATDIFEDVRRSTAILQLAIMRRRDLLTNTDLARLSEAGRNLIMNMVRS